MTLIDEPKGALDTRPTKQTSAPERSRRHLRPEQIGLYGLLIVAALTALLPLVWMLSGSLQSLTELLSNDSFLPASPQWANYVTAWVQGDLGTYMRNSVVYTGTAVIGILLVSSLAGYALARLEFAPTGVPRWLSRCRPRQGALDAAGRSMGWL
jgi:ABC-type glycerol-3-phosphate transport system permease component